MTDSNYTRISANEFEVGDVVQLTCDAVVSVTVEQITAAGLVSCVWFDQDDKLQRECFSPQMLSKA